MEPDSVTGPEAKIALEPEMWATADAAARADVELAEELLVEEVSIDGMCGVY